MDNQNLKPIGFIANTQKTKYYAVREVEEKNFNPMCWHFLDKKNDVQALIFFAPDKSFIWITVHRADLVKTS